MDRETAQSKLKGMKAKAKAARAEGKRDMAKAFRAGAKRLARTLKAMPKPVEKKEE